MDIKRAIRTVVTLGILAASASPALGYSFLERMYGTPQLGLSPRSRAMGGAGAAFGNGAFSLVDNPGALVVDRGNRVQLSGVLSRASENRFVPIFDTFDSFVDENAIAVNDVGYGSVLGGVVLDRWDESGFIVSAGVFDRYDPRYDYKDERRSTLTSDEIINNLYIETTGILRSATVGAAYAIPGGHGVGVAFNYYFSDYRDRVALVPRTASSDRDEKILNRSLRGWSVTLGQIVNLNERVRLGVAVETKPQIDDDYEIRVNGDLVTDENSNGDLKLPLRVQGGAVYRPRNDLKTTFALDAVYMGWQDLVESIPAETWQTLAGDRYPPTSLQDTWEVRFGLEHVFYNGLPARIGFRYGESYALDEADRVAFTFGFGYLVNGLGLDLSGEVMKRNSRQDPVRPREEQGNAVGAGRDRVEDTLVLVSVGATYNF